MNIYKVECKSSCGSYFGSYLQSVTVVAKSEGDAIAYVKKWLKKNGEGFIYPEKEWNVFIVCTNIHEGAIIDTHEDSDY